MHGTVTISGGMQEPGGQRLPGKIGNRAENIPDHGAAGGGQVFVWRPHQGKQPAVFLLHPPKALFAEEQPFQVTLGDFRLDDEKPPPAIGILVDKLGMLPGRMIDRQHGSGDGRQHRGRWSARPNAHPT
jgi:hypothetical protein